MEQPANPCDVEWAELEKYRHVFYATPDYVTFSNLETGVFIDVNPGFEKIIGWKRDEVIGRTSADIDLWVINEDRPAAIETLRKNGSMSISTLLRTRTEEIIHVEASLATCNVNGEMLLVAVARDVTLRKRQELELEQYRTQLEQLVEQRTVELDEALQRVKDLAVHDELTGLGNRRDLNNQLQMERQLFERIGIPSSIAVLDLDGFKSVNDRFGHSVGDEVIKAFARIFQKERRVVDYVARYGGDEFIILLKGTTAEAARIPLARILDAVRNHAWSEIAPGIALTVSIGVAGFRKSETADDTFKRADKALYVAKTNGKNQIAVAPSDDRAGVSGTS